MNKSEDNEIAINFAALWSLTKKNIWIILLSGFLLGVCSALYVFSKPNEYTSLASVMPELEASSAAGGLSKFAGLASLAGIDLSNLSTSDAVRPDLYPSIINNTSYFLFLLEQNVNLSNGKSVKFKDFYYEVYDIDKDKINGTKKGITDKLREMLGIAVQPISASKDAKKDLVYLSKSDGEVIEELGEKIVANMDKKTGIISISVKLPDPITAAHVAQISMNYLTNFVVNYRTEKARVDRDFLKQQLDEAKGKYYNDQSKKAQYSDQFQAPTIRLQVADIRRERIEADYKVSSTFYTQLFQQYETAKMKVQEQTPVFKTLQKPIIPYEKSGPRRMLIILFCGFLGAVIGLVIVLLKKGNYKTIFSEN
jgi:uncharacterized protein involved in exopolysaccharide biosynthesis